MSKANPFWCKLGNMYIMCEETIPSHGIGQVYSHGDGTDGMGEWEGLTLMETCVPGSQCHVDWV